MVQLQLEQHVGDRFTDLALRGELGGCRVGRTRVVALEPDGCSGPLLATVAALRVDDAAADQTRDAAVEFLVALVFEVRQSSQPLGNAFENEVDGRPVGPTNPTAQRAAEDAHETVRTTGQGVEPSRSPAWAASMRGRRASVIQVRVQTG